MRTRCTIPLSSILQQRSPHFHATQQQLSVANLAPSPGSTPTPSIQPCAENESTLFHFYIRSNLHRNPHYRRHPDRRVWWVWLRHFSLPSRRSFRAEQVEQPWMQIHDTWEPGPFLLSLCLRLLCCETGEKLGVVEDIARTDARERIARFVTSIQGPKACCATLRRLPSSLGITVRVFSPPTGHRHGPSGVSIDRVRPKLSSNRSIRGPTRSKLIVPA